MSLETKSFQAETKQLLDLMIHSIYTHKDIFLRELISNASDAIDKMKFISLTDTALLEDNKEFKIDIEIDKDNNTLTIKDNGIGMTYDQVIENIGTIAKSGSKAFKEKLAEAKNDNNPEIIGQFGVGFYSAFMAGKEITLITKSYESEKGVKWVSSGDGAYTIEDFDKKDRGSEIIIKLRDGEDDNCLEYTKEYKISELIKKYSDYIRYPILMDFTKEVKPKDAEGKEIEDAPVETVIETKTLNSMTPLWRKKDSEISKDEYNEFYKSNFHDWQDPLKTFHVKVEGNLDYTALLYIPSKAPMDFYSKEFNKGVQLYSKNVFIMENCPELIPDYFRFVKGLVDSADFSLNISREILQNNRQLKTIAKHLEKKIIKELKMMQKNDKEAYGTFWSEFGEAIKSGLYSGYDTKEKLEDLLIFESSNGNKTTLAEYLDRMKDDQEYIYYATGENLEQIKKLPQLEILEEKDYEVLFFDERIDEFAIERMITYKEKQFKSITKGDLDLKESEEEKKENEKLAEDNKSLLEIIKESLDGKVSDVKLSNRLKSTAVCLVAGDDGISLGMEKIMKDMQSVPGFDMKASRILEINPKHSLFTSLKSIYDKDPKNSDLKGFASLLYSQALLIEGIALESPADFAKELSDLMVKAYS